MASYTTQLLDWGQQGTAYPSGYSYTDDIPPIEEYDDYAMYHLIRDVKHLVGLTNSRLESSSGTTAERPSNPESGHQFWNTEDSALEIYDSGFGGWRVLALDEGLSAHLADTTNPHSVTAAQVGAPTTADLADHENDTTNPHGVTAAQAGAPTTGDLADHENDTTNPHSVTPGQIGAATDSHLHDNRYARLFDGVQAPVYQNLGDVPSGIGKGEIVFIDSEGKLYVEDGN